MELALKRYGFGEKSTLGKLYVDDSFFCYTLEPKVRELDGVPVEQWKIDGKTAIPKGRYRIIIDFSNRFKRELPHLLDIPGFVGVRVHPGNSDVNTEGCILVGSSVVNDDFIANSVATFTHLFDMIETACERAEDITIEIA